MTAPLVTRVPLADIAVASLFLEAEYPDGTPSGVTQQLPPGYAAGAYLCNIPEADGWMIATSESEAFGFDQGGGYHVRLISNVAELSKAVADGDWSMITVRVGHKDCGVKETWLVVVLDARCVAQHAWLVTHPPRRPDAQDDEWGVMPFNTHSDGSVAATAFDAYMALINDMLKDWPGDRTLIAPGERI